MSEEKNIELEDVDAVEAKPKSGVSIIKITVVAAVVMMVFSGGYVFLKKPSEDGIVIDQPTEVVQQPVSQPAPVSNLPSDKKSSSDSFDLMADAISEKGTSGSLPTEINTNPEAASQQSKSLSAEYVDIEKYNNLLSDFNNIKARLESLELSRGGQNDSSSTNGNVEKRLSSLEKRVKTVESVLENSAEAIAAMNVIVEQNKKAAFERDGNLRTDVPLSAKGRSRLVGYQYSMGTENKDVSIVINDSGTMTVLTKGVVVDYGGKKMTVTGVIDSDEVILVGDEYFIDKTKGVGPKISSGSKQASVTASSSQDRQVKKQALNRVRHVSGWKILALTPDLSGNFEATIELPSGKLITLVRGESTKVYGKVNKIDESGVYFDGYKINMDGR